MAIIGTLLSGAKATCPVFTLQVFDDSACTQVNEDATTSE